MTHTYPRIDPADIRKGDAIRFDYTEPFDVTAAEYVASRDGQGYTTRLNLGNHFLIDRPAPPVALPTEPTLGWATWGDEQYLGVFVTRGVNLRAVDSEGATGGDRDTVTAFTPATAVPTEALDELREAQERAFDLTTDDEKNVCRRGAIEIFLDAVDKAAS